jgi:hypothetical protein
LGRRNWKKRWFVLGEGAIIYYTDEASANSNRKKIRSPGQLSRDACYKYVRENAKGFLDLSECAATVVKGSKYEYHFEVAPTAEAQRGARDLQLRADTPEEMEVGNVTDRSNG